MDVVKQYSSEVLYMLLQNINQKNEKVLDIVQLLMMSAEDGEKNHEELILGLEEINQTTKEINTKIDSILVKLTKIEEDFFDLKNENRDIEQKITLMTAKLSKLESLIEGEDLEDYYALAQSLYSNWDELDVLTRMFIPLAEYLYSKLQKYDKPDYSPVILELCRAFENEFLLKIFRKYTLDLIKRKEKLLDNFLAIDRATLQLKNDTGQFVKAISKAARTNKPEYTLGQMNMILVIIKRDEIVKKSPLLRDFKDYLEKNTESKNLLDSKHIEKINEIVVKYRNPSAHPEFMNLKIANECREIMPERIDYLMDCILS